MSSPVDIERNYDNLSRRQTKAIKSLTAFTERLLFELSIITLAFYFLAILNNQTVIVKFYGLLSHSFRKRLPEVVLHNVLLLFFIRARLYGKEGAMLVLN